MENNSKVDQTPSTSAHKREHDSENNPEAKRRKLNSKSNLNDRIENDPLANSVSQLYNQMGNLIALSNEDNLSPCTHEEDELISQKDVIVNGDGGSKNSYEVGTPSNGLNNISSASGVDKNCETPSSDSGSHLVSPVENKNFVKTVVTDLTLRSKSTYLFGYGRTRSLADACKLDFATHDDLPFVTGYLPYDDKSTTTTILDLSDEILLMILVLCGTRTISSVSCTCTHLRRVCMDTSLWKVRNAFCKPKIRKSEMVDIDGYKAVHFSVLHPASVEPEQHPCLTFHKLHKMMQPLTRVHSMVFNGHLLSRETFHLRYLPKCLRSLTLRNCKIPPDEGYCLANEYKNRIFTDIQIHLPNLERLNVSYCDWFDAYAFLAIGKLPQLRILRITASRCTTEFVNYASIAVSVGFQCLQTLDLRLTPVSDREIQCFTKLQTIKQFYLQNPYPNLPTFSEGITDFGILTFGLLAREDVDDLVIGNIRIIGMRPEHSPFVNNHLESLMVRNYHNITDHLLQHIITGMTRITYLDIRGTSCTEEAVQEFERFRPDVKVLFEPYIPGDHNFEL